MNKSAFNDNNDIKTEKRDETILVKVTPTEREQIKKYAEAAGYSGKVSPYIRRQALRPCTDSSTGKLSQEIASLLCRHAQLVEKMDDQALRKHFIDWESAIWQSLKP